MADNVYTKGYSDGAALTESQLDTAFKSLKLDISNTTSLTAGSTSGQFLKSNGADLAASFASVPDPLGLFALRNYGLSTSVSSGALTVALKTKALGDPSTSDAVDFTYSTNGTTSATYNAVQVTSALSFTITASATLGFTGTSTNRVYVYGYFNTSTSGVKLAVSARSDLDTGNKVSTTAMGASADSTSVLYATAVLNVAPRLLGYVESALNSSKQWQTVSKVNVSNDADINIASTSLFNRSQASTAPIGGIALSSSSGSFSTTNSTATDVTNLSVTLTTTGRPVVIEVIPDGNASSNTAQLAINGSSNTQITATYQILRDSTSIYETNLGTSVSGNGANFLAVSAPPSALRTYDFVAAGTYTYKVRAWRSSATGAGSTNTFCSYSKLVAYEI